MAENRPPNILLFFCDQFRFDAIQALGNPVIRTPHLDRLVREGVAFTSAYSPDPVCVPARASLIYGQYPWSTGCYENRDPMPTDGRLSLMDVLARAGYRTHGIGKCHFTPDRHALRGFQARERQEELVTDPAEDDYLTFLRDNGFGHLDDPHGVRGEMYYIPQPAQMPARLHPTQWVGDRTVAFVAEQADRSQPWMLFSSFVHPHPPFAPPAPWHKLYRAPHMPLPNVPRDAERLWTWINARQNRYKYRDQGLDANLLRCMKAYYYACVSFIDYQIGRVYEALEQSGQLERTLMLFTADHGEHLGDRNCFGKRSLHDSAARVPMLARLPGRFEGGLRCDQVASLVDVAPTLAAAAGAPVADVALEGVDLAALQAGTCRRDEVFAQHDRAGEAQYMVVNRRWKYLYSVPDGMAFLFDREQDPLETRNLADNAFSVAEQRTLKALLIDALCRHGETDALADGDWKPQPRRELPRNPDAGLINQDHPWASRELPGYNC